MTSVLMPAQTSVINYCLAVVLLLLIRWLFFKIWWLSLCCITDKFHVDIYAGI